MKKSILTLFLISLLLITTVAAFSFNLDQFFIPPKITNAQLSLEKVTPGDELLITIEAQDTFGIKQTSATIRHERGQDTVNFELISGTKQKGTWQGKWIVHDTLIDAEYDAVITVENRHGETATKTLTFLDPIVSHTPDQIIPQGAGSGLDADTVDAIHASSLSAGGGSGTTYNYIYVYLTESTYNGNLGNIAGGDLKCAASRPTTIPTGLTYKAYLCNTTNCQKPVAGINTMVVFMPSTGNALLPKYTILNLIKSPDQVTTKDGTYDAMKNGLSGVYQSAATQQLSGLGLIYQYWTGANYMGYNNGYTSVYEAQPSASVSYTCGNWLSTSGTGYYGDPSGYFSDYSWISLGSSGCSGNYRLLCFAQ